MCDASGERIEFDGCPLASVFQFFRHRADEVTDPGGWLKDAPAFAARSHQRTMKSGVAQCGVDSTDDNQTRVVRVEGGCAQGFQFVGCQCQFFEFFARRQVRRDTVREGPFENCRVAPAGVARENGLLVQRCVISPFRVEFFEQAQGGDIMVVFGDG